jgi:hypothetical protein
MNNIIINVFNSIKDNVVKPFPIEWIEVIELFQREHSQSESKTDSVLFNTVEYHSQDTAVLRRKKNIKSIQAIVLDYDGGCTLTEIQSKLEAYEYLGYTSYSHGIDGLDKFRIILPVTKPISYHYDKRESGDWPQIVPALKVFFDGCDPASFRAGQIFAIPQVHPTRLHLAQVWHNKGKPFDWEPLDRNIENSSVHGDCVQPSTSLDPVTNKLFPDTVLQSRHGAIIVGEVSQRISGVLCLFHDDKKPTEFLNVSDNGHIFLHCHKCGTIFMERPVASHRLHPLQASDIWTPEQIERVSLFGELDVEKTPLQPREFVIPDRSKVTEQMKKIAEEIIKGKEAPWGREPLNHVVYTPEGAGKSMLAILIALSYNYRVIFACKSWQQAIKKAAEFRQLTEKEGLIVELALSIEGHIKNRFGISAIRKPASGPFAPGEIDAEKTIHAIKKAHPDINPKLIDLFWQLIQPQYNRPNATPDKLDLDLGWPLLPSRAFNKDSHSPLLEVSDQSTGDCSHAVNPYGCEYKEFTDKKDRSKYGHFDWHREVWKLDLPENQFKTANIVVTTTAQAQLLPKLKGKSPTPNWIIFIDDPDLQDILKYTQYKNSDWPKMKSSQIEANTKEINGKRYFERDVKDYLGMLFRKNSVVFTTTESLILRAIEHQFDKFESPYVQFQIGRSKPRRFHNSMENLTSGNVSILGTRFVRANLDGIIPPIVERLKKMGHKVELIADGMGSNINHSTSKGNNSFQKTHLIIELSIPHPDQITTVCESLNLDFATNKRDITISLMLDKMHQAIGRNSGYRYDGAECIVLTDPKFYRDLIKGARYQVSVSALIDRTATMSRKDRRTPDDATSLIKDLETLLMNNKEYVHDRRKFKSDVLNYLKTISDANKKEKAIQRMFRSMLYQSTGSEKCVSTDDKKLHKPYRQGAALLLKQLPKRRRKFIVNRTRKLFK